MENETGYYALFLADPLSNPPFNVILGTGIDMYHKLEGCQHIPDAITKIEGFCHEKGIILAPTFVLLYPIYLEAMGTEHENTMLQVAWLIKDEAEKKGWEFNRIGGYTGLGANNFIPN
jgi:hypothetical protein